MIINQTENQATNDIKEGAVLRTVCPLGLDDGTEIPSGTKGVVLQIFNSAAIVIKFDDRMRSFTKEDIEDWFDPA